MLGQTRATQFTFIKTCLSAGQSVKTQGCIQFLYLTSTLLTERKHASRIKASSRTACCSHLFRHVAGSVASPLHMVDDRKDPVAAAEERCWNFAVDSQQAVAVPASPAVTLIAGGAVQLQPAGQSQRTPGGREEGKREGGRQRGRGRKLYQPIAETETAY